MRGKIIAVSGIDGCGKTTVIEELKVLLSRQGVPVEYVWLRYNHYLTKVVLLLGRLRGLTWYEAKDPRVGYHEFYKSKFISWLFICSTFIDTCLASLVRVYIPAFIFGKTIICDRWVLDIIVDLGVDTREPVSLTALWVRCFLALIPREAKCFIIERDSRLVEMARSEHRLDRYYPLRLALFKQVASFPVATIIANNAAKEQAAQQIFNLVRKL